MLYCDRCPMRELMADNHRCWYRYTLGAALIRIASWCAIVWFTIALLRWERLIN